MNPTLKNRIYGEHLRRGDWVLSRNIAVYPAKYFFEVTSARMHGPPLSLGDVDDKTGAWKNYLESLVLE